MERYLCIHGHFYQPPRENPWLEETEIQDSARPYHDWNARITAECYEPNALSRILDEKNRILSMVNNYAKMSFDFGPTLLMWLEKKAPKVYQAIQEADRESRNTFSGHGSALAQAYNHMILPLATSRDKYTQILWGIRDFEYRFGRAPEGMWLPETAVDRETLGILADMGIKFTILAPHQAERIRLKGTETWSTVKAGDLDTTQPYLLHLGSGKEIALFFYSGPISRAVAFEHLLNRGEEFAQRLMSGFSQDRTDPQLVHIATDGESYGHHHQFGNMALTYALHYLESNNFVRITNYGEYLEKAPPLYEVEIVENTSWSCAHGIERWRNDCGCNSGAHPEWNQSWRAPLREALDWLRDMLVPLFETKAAELLKDPWSARNDYIAVVLNRSADTVEDFLTTHSLRPLNEREKVNALKLLELQRHTMLMYTSCGWFFDELSGIETIQIIQYASRALQLAEEFLEDNHLETGFLTSLELAKGNSPQHPDGRILYDERVRPAVADMKKIAAHYAVYSLFAAPSQNATLYCYQLVPKKDYHSFERQKARGAVGNVEVISLLTRESATLVFGVVYSGDLKAVCGVKESPAVLNYQEIILRLQNSLSHGEATEPEHVLQECFDGSVYSFKSLYRDDQKRILGFIVDAVLSGPDGLHSRLQETCIPLAQHYSSLNLSLPLALKPGLKCVLENQLRQTLRDETFEVQRVHAVFEQAALMKISFDRDFLEEVFTPPIERLSHSLPSLSHDLLTLERLDSTVDILRTYSLTAGIWKLQNAFHEILHGIYPKWRVEARQGNQDAQEWLRKISSLSEKLSFRVPL
ncbi:MAG: DUF3536 domain-containing protein [Deltaproteobacteria bacterium]|nr:DUF3536 domain-containing protein [Deltaproteobacteria bacterium]